MTFNKIRFISQCLLLCYVVTLTHYAIPYAKKDFIAYSTIKLENAIVALNGKPSLKVPLNEDVIADVGNTLPPAQDINQIAQNYPAANSDIVQDLLKADERMKNGRTKK